MCLIAFSYRESDDWPLVLVANRDEFHQRPSLPLGRWQDHPHVIGGRDLQAGGGWLAATENGRFAAVTNYRDPQFHDPSKHSRGELLASFVVGTDPPRDFAGRLSEVAQRYNLMNMVFGTLDELYCFGSRSQTVRRLTPGLYGLSNASLDDPWPKVQRAKAGLRRLLQAGPPEPEPLFELLRNTEQARDQDLPHTGLSIQLERLVSSVFITSEKYGTRASTIVTVSGDGQLTATERSFEPDGSPKETHSVQLPLKR